jgi:glycosyltransferase involved in cell wall biosynthesis
VAWQCGYEYHPGRLEDLVLSTFIPHFDHHLAYHSNAKQYAVRYGSRADQVTVMHNTVNEAKIACLPKPHARAKIDERVPQLAGRLIVLYVGAVLEEKRLEEVIRALDVLADASLAFLVVGDGPHLGRLREMATGRRDVFFAGRVVEGVGSYFDAADMFVLPGTGGLALNEAMAHSLRLISGYADGSADDLVQDGVNGFRLKNGDAPELAQRISELANDPELRLRMGRASRALITTRFSFESFIARVTGVLDDLSNR